MAIFNWKSKLEGIGFFNYVILIIGFLELVTVRLIGYPLETTPQTLKVIYFLGSSAHWLGGASIFLAYIWVLLQFQKEQRSVSIFFTLLIWLLLASALLSIVFPTLNSIKIFLYSCSFLTILFLFNLGRQQIDRQSHIICCFFAAPLLFRFLYLLLESFHTAGMFFFPPEVYNYLRYVDEILMLIALLGIGMVVFDKITFPWNIKKTFALSIIFLCFSLYIFFLFIMPWSTLAVTQELGFSIFSKNQYFSMLFYAVPFFLGLSSVFLLFVEAKTFTLGCGLLFILLGQSSMSHTSIFYQFLSLLGLLYLLYDGVKKPKYILGRRSAFAHT